MFSSISDVDLKKQVASLSKELAALKRQMSRRGRAIYADGREAVSDYYSDIAERVSDRHPDLRNRARALEDAVREHPAAAAAGLRINDVQFAHFGQYDRLGHRVCSSINIFF